MIESRGGSRITLDDRAHHTAIQANGLQRNAAIAPISSGRSKRFSSDDGRIDLQNSCSNCSRVCFICVARLSIKAFAPAEAVGPGSSVFTVTPVPAGRLGEAARNCELGGLGHAVVNHLGGDLDARFAGDEEDAAPVALLHAGQVVAAQANAAHDVHFEEAEPVFVRDLFKRLHIEDAEVVHHIDIGEALDGLCDAIGGAEVGGETFGFQLLPMRSSCFRAPSTRAAVRPLTMT